MSMQWHIQISKYVWDALIQTLTWHIKREASLKIVFLGAVGFIVALK